jgi:hypothetical protein
MPIDFPSILQSTCIFCVKRELNGQAVSVKIYWTGTGDFHFYFGLSSTADVIPSTWEEVTGLTSGVTKTYTLTGTGTALYYRIIKDASINISTQQNYMGNRTAPAIQIGGLV